MRCIRPLLILRCRCRYELSFCYVPIRKGRNILVMINSRAAKLLPQKEVESVAGIYSNM